MVTNPGHGHSKSICEAPGLEIEILEDAPSVLADWWGDPGIYPLVAVVSNPESPWSHMGVVGPCPLSSGRAC